MRVLLAVLLVSIPQGIFADLKVSFAFNDRLLSLQLPSLDYRVMTSRVGDGQQIAITGPAVYSGKYDDFFALSIGILLEALPGDVDPKDFFRSHLRAYLEETGNEYPQAEDPYAGRLVLRNASTVFLRYGDSRLRAHKALLIAAVDETVGVVILLDAVEDAFEEMEPATARILESIRFVD